MNTIAIIGCIVGIITCIVGVATFISAQLSKANQDGRLLERVEYACRGIDEIKKDVKEKNKEIDRILDDHTERIAKLESEIDMLKKA